MTVGSSRALRNNNPGNIRLGSPWQGLAGVQNDPDFCMFKAPRWGFRAMAVTLVAYQDKHGLRTVRQIVGRWAPPGENDTGAYVQHVCGLTGFAPDAPLDMHSWHDCSAMVKAIATHESGGWLFDDRELEAGLRSAGIEPPEAPFIASRGVPPKIAAVGTLATGGAMETLRDARDQFSEYAYVFAWGAKVMMGLTLAIIGYELWKHYGWKKVGLR